MAYKIGSNASINDNQDGDFEVIKVSSANQIVIGGELDSTQIIPPGQGETAAYFAGGGNDTNIPYGYNFKTGDHPNGILDPAGPSIPGFGAFSPQPASADDIQKYSFASQGTASDIGELAEEQRFAATGINNDAHGYILGGGAVKANQSPGSDFYAGGTYGEDMTSPHSPELVVSGSAIDKFNFASQTNSANPNSLNAPRMHHGSVDFNDSSGGFAYSAGGFNVNPFGPATNALDSTEKFTFSSATSAAGVGALPTIGGKTGRFGMYAVQSTQNGYFINGHYRIDQFIDSNFGPSVSPQFQLLPSVPGLNQVDKISAASGAVTGNIQTVNNVDGRSFGASVSSLEYGYIAGGTIEGQRIRGRGPSPVPGRTQSNWAPPTGMWLDPSLSPTSYPEAAHHDIPGTSPPGPAGGALSGWLLGYGITHFLSGSDPLQQHYYTQVSPVGPSPNAGQPTGAIGSDHQITQMGRSFDGNQIPASPDADDSGIRVSYYNGLSDPTLNFANGDNFRNYYTAPDGTQVAKFLYPVEHTNPYTGERYYAFGAGDDGTSGPGHRFQPADENPSTGNYLGSIRGNPGMPFSQEWGLRNSPYGASDNTLKINESGVYWSPTPANQVRSNLIQNPVPYPMQQEHNIPSILYGDITYNQLVESAMYSVEWDPGVPGGVPELRVNDQSDVGRALHATGSPNIDFGVYAKIPLVQSWEGDVIRNGMFTNSRWNIEKFPFAIEHAPSTEVIDFQFTGYDFHDWSVPQGSPFAGTPTRIGMTGASSTTHGILAGGGGFNGTPTVDLAPYTPNIDAGFGSSSLRYSTISKFPFAIVTGNTTDVGELTSGGYNHASFQE